MNFNEWKNRELDHAFNGMDQEDIDDLTKKMKSATTLDEVRKLLEDEEVYNSDTEYDDMYWDTVEELLEPDIPDWDLEFNDLFEHEQIDEPDMLLAFENIKEHYALLRHNLGKIDGYASEAIYALEQIDNLSSYTDFDLDELNTQLNEIQNTITEWQQSMRLIPYITLTNSATPS